MSQTLPEPFVRCENLVKIFKVENIEVVALQGLDLTVNKGELMAIIGPSGSGKSSLMNILGGLDAPSAGRAEVNGNDLLKMSQTDRLRYRRLTVGFVWQNVGRNLIPYLSALENVEIPMIASGRFDRPRARMLLQLVGLGHRMHHRPQRMSGGEQQRVAIAIALANSPPMLLADEPTGNVDTRNATNIIRVLDRVRHELGATVIIVTHDHSLANSVDRYVSITDGKTSAESVRRNGMARAEDRGEDEENHEHYVLLDSAGRLQLSEEMRESLGIQRRVKMRQEEGRIVILPPEDDPQK